MEWFNLNVDITLSLDKLIETLLGGSTALGSLYTLFIYKGNVFNIINDLRSLVNKENQYIKIFRTTMEDLEKDLYFVFPIPKLKNIDYKRKMYSTTPRDAVLNSWSRLLETLERGNVLYSNKPSTINDPQQKIYLLYVYSIITLDQAEALISLYKQGKEQNDNPQWDPLPESAFYYQQATELLIGWLVKKFPPEVSSQKTKPPRKTTVNSSFDTSAPSHTHPAAVLMGVSGQMQGRIFNVNKELFSLGANKSNDITISNDDFVSGNHAILHSISGGLFLLDQHSRNGTFLNDKQLVADKASPVNIGDKIRIGNSVFKVTDK